MLQTWDNFAIFAAVKIRHFEDGLTIGEGSRTVESVAETRCEI